MTRLAAKKSGVLQHGADPVATILDRGVGQPDDRELREFF